MLIVAYVDVKAVKPLCMAKKNIQTKINKKYIPGTKTISRP